MIRSSLSTLITLAAAVTTALMAGLFYAFTVSVVPGLKRLPDLQYLAAMQSINRAILNPVFFLAFLGTVILLPWCTYLHYTKPLTSPFWWLLGAALFYVIGVMAITIFGNVPLNEALEKFVIQGASEQQLNAQRLLFETRWNNLNLIRTISSFASLVLVLIALLKSNSLS